MENTDNTAWMNRMAAMEKADTIVDIVNKWRDMSTCCPDVRICSIEPVCILEGIDLLADAVGAKLQENDFTERDESPSFYYHFKYKGVRFAYASEEKLVPRKGGNADGEEGNGG